MLKVFIYDDDLKSIKSLEGYIASYNNMYDYNMQLVHASPDPAPILEYLQQHEGTIGLYILYADANSKFNGIEFAKKIRKHDIWGFIIFIARDNDMQMQAFDRWLETMDYIIKDTPKFNEYIIDCFNIANQKLSASQKEVKLGFLIKLTEDVKMHDGNIIVEKGGRMCVQRHTILYFKTVDSITRKIVMRTVEGDRHFSGMLSGIEKKLDGDKRFYKCQGNLIVNVEMIASTDSHKGIAVFSNNDTVDINKSTGSKISKYIDELIKNAKN